MLGQSLPLLCRGSNVLTSGERGSGLHSLCPGAFSLCLLSGLPGTGLRALQRGAWAWSWFGLGVLAPELILHLGLSQGFLLPPSLCPKDFSTVLAPAHSSFPPLSTAADYQVLTSHLRAALRRGLGQRCADTALPSSVILPCPSEAQSGQEADPGGL